MSMGQTNLSELAHRPIKKKSYINVRETIVVVYLYGVVLCVLIFCWNFAYNIKICYIVWYENISIIGLQIYFIRLWIC